MKLAAGEHYFGLAASALHVGAERVLARIATLPPQQQRVDLRSLSEDFRVIRSESSALLSAMLAEGLLHPDGSGGYRPTSLFKEYAEASVVSPLPRERARALLDEAIALAVRINGAWISNPYAIEAIAVSGSFITASDPVKDLLLSLIVGPRGPRPEGSGTAPLAPEEAMRQIRRAMNAIDPFVSVRVVNGRQSVPRPFAILFQAGEDEKQTATPAPSLGRTFASLMRKRT